MNKITRKIRNLFNVDAPMKSINTPAFISVDTYETKIEEINYSYKYAVTTVEVGGHVLEGNGANLKGLCFEEAVVASLKAWLYESGFDASKNAASSELAGIIETLIDEISADI